MHIINPDDILICPKCKSEVSFDGASCPNCNLIFSANGVTPTLIPPKISAFIVILLALILIPQVALVFGDVLESLIPGCHCNLAGNHCSSCGSLGEIILFLKFNGLTLYMVELFLAPLILIICLPIHVMVVKRKKRAKIK